MADQRFIDARDLHRNLDYLGLRAQATMVGLIHLCTELVRAGVLGDDAVERIKDAIHRDVMVANVGNHHRDEVDTTLRQRLNELFPNSRQLDHNPTAGGLAELQRVFGTLNADADAEGKPQRWRQPAP